MKKVKTLLCVLGILSSVNAFADEVCRDKNGSLRCGSGTVKSIDYRGFVDVNGTTVEGSSYVLGNATVQDANLHSLEVRGDTNLGKSTVSGPMKMIGNVTIKNTNISGRADIVGNFYGGHVTMSSNTQIVGSVECEFCIFKNDATLIGDVAVSHSQFLNGIVLNIKKATFVNSKMNDITVKKSSERYEQVIKLKENSSVHNIAFESQKGIVILSGNSVITGSVQGGKIIKE